MDGWVEFIPPGALSLSGDNVRLLERMSNQTASGHLGKPQAPDPKLGTEESGASGSAENNHPKSLPCLAWSQYSLIHYHNVQQHLVM